MDQAEASRRWDTAQELYQAAMGAFRQQHYKAAVSLAYYACFQAMWVALGDPPLGRWQHTGIIRSFCHGQWAVPPLAPTALAVLHKRLLALYTLRLDAHYRAQRIPSEQTQYGLETVAEVMRLVHPPQERDHQGGMMGIKAIKYPALQVSAATAELVKGILALYPQAEILPRIAPLEDEEISVEVKLPLEEDEIYEARDHIHDLVIQLQDRYDVLILAYAVPA